MAYGSIFARMTKAFVDISIAKYSSVARFTVTLVQTGVVEAETMLTVVRVIFRR